MREVPPVSQLRREVAGRPVESEPAARLVERVAGRELSRMARLNRMFVEAGEKYGVDPRLLYSICKKESGFRNYLTSPVGAKGLMQLMPGTAARLGVRDVFDEKQSIEGGARYLRFLLDFFKGDMAKAVAAYNAGEMAVKGWSEGIPFRNHRGRLMNAGRVRTANGLPPYRETLDYVRVVSGYWRTTDWGRQFGPEVASRLGGPRFVAPPAASLSAAPRAAREAARANVPASESARPVVAGDAAQAQARRASSVSRYYVGDRVVDEHSGESFVVARAGDKVGGGAEGAAGVDVKVGGVSVSPKAVSEQAGADGTFVDPFSNEKFVRVSAPGAAAAPATSRTSIYLGGGE